MTSLNTNNKRLGWEILTLVFELGFLQKCSYLLRMPSEIDKLNNLKQRMDYRNNGRVFFLRVSNKIFLPSPHSEIS